MTHVNTQAVDALLDDCLAFVQSQPDRPRLDYAQCKKLNDNSRKQVIAALCDQQRRGDWPALRVLLDRCNEEDASLDADHDRGVWP